MDESVIQPMVLNNSTLQVKLQKLRDFVSNYSSVIVAYSGGIDSSLLALVTTELLGKQNSLIITAKSPSVNSKELEYATLLAQKNDWNHKIIQTSEFQNQSYRDNKADRCYYCKTELYSLLESICDDKGYEVVFNGTNFDDLSDYRPGLKAADEKNIVSPLLECRINKLEVREIAKELALENWDKPAQPCLSSRVPYGIEITMKILKQIEEAENYLSELGFVNFRVRNHGSIARIELSENDLHRIMEKDLRLKITSYLRGIGFKFVSVDLLEFQSGNLNKNLKS